MPELMDDRALLALELLKLFPLSVGADAVKDGGFRERHGLSFDATITFNRSGVSIKRSRLYPAIRTLFGKRQTSVAVETTEGKFAELSMESDENRPKLFLSVEELREQIPSFRMLAESRDVRSTCFEQEVAVRYLPTKTVEAWKQKIEEHALSDDEIDDLIEDLSFTPQAIAAVIRNEFGKEEGNVSAVVPTSGKYYRNLIGDRGNASNVEEYAAGNARTQVEQLLNWDFKRGLQQCLLFCANPRLSALIDISGRSPQEVENLFIWLASDADRFSQIAGIEVGIRALAEYPKIEPILIGLIKDICGEGTTVETGRLALTANLFVFVDGELARRQTFANEPPYWRRLAATSQASMIERTIVTLGGTREDMSEWANLRAEDFVMQTLTDLREEPRWLPDQMNARQLRIELLTRARIAGLEMQDSLPDGPLRELLLGKGENQLEALTSVPSAYAPSPVEAGIESPKAFPEDLLTDLRNSLESEALEARTFASVVNFSQVFRFDHEIAGLISELLRKVQYRLDLEVNTDISFTLIMGLASVAASARHPELADEVRILARVLARRGDLIADAEGRMRIALVASASRKDMQEWCESVGDWLFEIANGEFEREEAARFRSYVRTLCHAVPELWQHTAKVDAAMAAISG